jgi:hypothetical protein
MVVNTAVRDLTVSCAYAQSLVRKMLRMLRDPPEPFGDIVRTHFRLKAKSLLAQLDEWLAKDDGKDLAGEGTDLHDRRSGSARSSLKSDIDEMKKLLTKLQKGQPLE